MEARQLEDEVEIEGGAPASVSDVGAASGADQIVSEGSQASGDVGVLADAGSVLSEGGVAHVVAAVASRPEGFHLRPLSERCGSLSTHTAPIKRTRPPFHAANVRIDAAASRLCVRGAGLPASCGL